MSDDSHEDELALCRTNEGYDEHVLETSRTTTLLPHALTNQNQLVRGVCFAAGLGSYTLATDFAEQFLSLRMIAWDFASITTDQLTEFNEEPYLLESDTAIVLSNVHVLSDALQAKLADIILANPIPVWFLAVTTHRPLIQRLKLAFVVYLGLSPDNHMRFLLQKQQRLLIDEGSLQKAPRSETFE